MAKARKPKEAITPSRDMIAQIIAEGQALRQAGQRPVRDRLRCRRDGREGAETVRKGVTLIHVSYGVGTICSLVIPFLLRADCAVRRGVLSAPMRKKQAHSST